MKFRLCDQLSFGGTLFDIASILLLTIAISRDIGYTFALISFLSFDIPLALLQKKPSYRFIRNMQSCQRRHLDRHGTPT